MWCTQCTKVKKNTLRWKSPSNKKYWIMTTNRRRSASGRSQIERGEMWGNEKDSSHTPNRQQKAEKRVTEFEKVGGSREAWKLQDLSHATKHTDV